jgi:hypothetical protein
MYVSHNIHSSPRLLTSKVQEEMKLQQQGILVNLHGEELQLNKVIKNFALKTAIKIYSKKMKYQMSQETNRLIKTLKRNIRFALVGSSLKF